MTTESNKVRVNPAWLIQDELGNRFFSDHATNTVWFYNTQPTSVSLFGTTVPSNGLHIVAGTGIAGTGAAGQSARLTALSFGSNGGGLAWDSDRRELYIADYNNNRVLRVASNGNMSLVCGGGAANNQGTSASSHQCNTPVDLAFDTSNRRLFVSLYGQHRIKYFDVSDSSVSNWLGYVLVGATSAGSSNSNAANTDGATNLTSFPSTTTSGASRLNGPWGLRLDTEDNILYFTEYGSCRIRALGLPGATSRTVAGRNITANNLNTLAGNGCAAATINANTATTPAVNNLFSRPWDIELYKTSGSITAVLVSDNGGNRISAINNTGSSITLGNQSITAGNLNNIFGNGSATVPSVGSSGKQVIINAPVSMSIQNDVLYVASRGTSLIRTLDLSAEDGAVNNFLGGTARAGYSGNSPLDSQLVTFNAPLSLLYKQSNNTLYVSDSANGIIRSVNLTNGRVEDYIGNGTPGTENRVNTVSTVTAIQASRAMTIYNDFFLYADGGANNCFIRAYNPLPTDELIFNSLVNLNKTSPIAGFYNNCLDFVGTSGRLTTDSNARFRTPYGIAANSEEGLLYISSQTSHCILTVTDDGTMTPVIGTCGSAGGSVTLGGSYPDSTLLLNNPAEVILDPLYPENFMFVDFSTSTSSHIKYVNRTDDDVCFFGSNEGNCLGPNVMPDTTATILAATSSPGYIRALAAFEDWICYTSGTTTANQGNNTVVCRDRSTGDQQVFGVPGAGGIALGGSNTQENANALLSTAITFAAPSGLAFDSDGNLYISEQGSHVIRKIKRWW
jgi:hypothetical protein